MGIGLSDNDAIQYQSKESYRGYWLSFYRTSYQWGCKAKKGRRWLAGNEAEELSSAIQMTKREIDQQLYAIAVGHSYSSPSIDEISAGLKELRRNADPVVKDVIEVLTGLSRPVIDLVLVKQKLGCATMTEIYVALAELGRAICDELGIAPGDCFGERDAYLNFVLKPEIHYNNHLNNSRLELHEQFYGALCNSQ